MSELCLKNSHFNFMGSSVPELFFMVKMRCLFVLILIVELCEMLTEITPISYRKSLC